MSAVSGVFGQNAHQKNRSNEAKRTVWQLFLGSLTGAECRRALNRPWVLTVRALSTLPAAVIVVAATWFWWISTRFERSFSPSNLFAGALIMLEGFLVTAALVLSPAMLAGALSGERVRGVLAMLLASEVSTREIIEARLIGRLSVVSAFLLTSAPGLMLLGSLNGWGLGQLIVALLLPVAVAAGGGGLAVGASSLARRGRDSLLGVFLVELVALIAPVFSNLWLPPAVRAWIAPFNPFLVITPLVETPYDAQPALRAIGLWCLLGLCGAWWAAWRMRPNYLRDADAAPSRRTSRRELVRVPPVSDRPLVWKELYIEQLRSTQRIARALGILVVAAVLLTSAGLAATWMYATATKVGDLATWASAQMSVWIGMTALPLGWLLQWSLGLRAAVSIASERERSTWDALLTSPLEGREIVSAKFYGNLYALRAYLAMVFISWTLAVVCGAMAPMEYASLVANTLGAGAYMVAIGLWASLANSSATVAMTLTLVGWLIGVGVLAIAAAILVLVLMLMGTLLYLATSRFNPALMQQVANVGFGSWFSLGYTVVRPLLYLATAGLIAIYCRQNFDRLAGRLAPSLFRAVPARVVRGEMRAR